MTRKYGIYNILFIFMIPIMNNEVIIHPIISSDMNQSGQFRRTGKSVSDDNQVRKVKPVKNAGKLIPDIHQIKYVAMRLTTSIT
jgi:hypothetical protein